MSYEYDLLDPIDFSTRNQAADAQATSVERLKNAAYEDSPRGTFSFFAFYRPIIEQYVDEFARKNPFDFPEEKKADLFWLTMRHAFAILRTYEHKGYGSFRNLLRKLVNYNALQTAEKMAYMEEMRLFDREDIQSRFVELASLCLVLRQSPEHFAKSKILRNFLFYPERMGDIDDAADEIDDLLREFRDEVDDECARYLNNKAVYGDLDALSPILVPVLGNKLAELIRKGGQDSCVDSFFGHIRKDPAWFGFPASWFEDDGATVSRLADAAQP